MNGTWMKRPSPAFVVALVALFLALGGTAGAVVTAAVPLAKRALSADNAKKVNGLTAKQIATVGARAGAELAKEMPGPASTAAGLITVKSTPWSLGANAEGDFAAICDAGQKAIGGGYDNPSGIAFSVDNRPTPDGASWKVYLFAGSGGGAGNIYAVCLK